MGAKPLVKNANDISYSDVAMEELKNNMIPFKIKRPLFDNKFEIITTEKDYKRLNIKNRKNIDYLKIKLNIKNLNKFTKFLKERLWKE